MCWLISTWSESAKHPWADTYYCNFEGCFVESAHVFVKQYGIIKGQFKILAVTILRYFIFNFWYAFFHQRRSKKSREKSLRRIRIFLSQFFNTKRSTLGKSLVKSNHHNHNTALFVVESFLLEVISRPQLPQNTLKNCLGKHIRALINTTLAASKFFLLFFIWINRRWKHNLDITVTVEFLTKLSEFGVLEDFYQGVVLAIWCNTYGKQQRFMKHQT